MSLAVLSRAHFPPFAVVLLFSGTCIVCKWRRRRRRRPLTIVHERPAVPSVVPAAALFPHTGVVGFALLVLDPSRRGRDGDNVKNNGEEQQQGHDPPAPRVGDPAAKHDRGFVGLERGSAS